MSAWLVMAANIVAVIASSVCAVFGILIWRMTRATWTLVMCIGFSSFFVVRLGIVADIPILEDYSRALTALVYVLFAAGFVVFWLNMHRFYQANGSAVESRLLNSKAARMVKLAEAAASKAAEAASKAAEAAEAAAKIAEASRAAASEANRITKESRG